MNSGLRYLVQAMIGAARRSGSDAAVAVLRMQQQQRAALRVAPSATCF
jgi:hypothetical protein